MVLDQIFYFWKIWKNLKWLKLGHFWSKWYLVFNSSWVSQNQKLSFPEWKIHSQTQPNQQLLLLLLLLSLLLFLFLLIFILYFCKTTIFWYKFHQFSRNFDLKWKNIMSLQNYIFKIPDTFSILKAMKYKVQFWFYSCYIAIKVENILYLWLKLTCGSTICSSIHCLFYFAVFKLFFVLKGSHNLFDKFLGKVNSYTHHMSIKIGLTQQEALKTSRFRGIMNIQFCQWSFKNENNCFINIWFGRRQFVNETRFYSPYCI